MEEEKVFFEEKAYVDESTIRLEWKTFCSLFGFIFITCVETEGKKY